MHPHWNAQVYVVLPANRVDPEDHEVVADGIFHDEDEADAWAESTANDHHGRHGRRDVGWNVTEEHCTCEAILR